MSRHLAVRCLFVLAALVVTGAYCFRDSGRTAAPSDRSPEAAEPADAASAALRGVVRDERGEAVPGAVIEAVRAGAESVSTRADSLGRYSLAGLAPGEYEVGWRPDPAAPGHRALALATLSPGETAEVDFGPGAPSGSAIRGIVSSGPAPLVDAAVLVSAEDRRLTLADLTDAAGEFEFSGVPAGSWSVMTRLDSTSLHERVEADGESDVRLDFSVPRGRLEVTVLDAATLEPIEGLRVAAQSGNGHTTLFTDPKGRAAFASLAPGESAAIRVSGSPRGGDGRLAYVPEDREAAIPVAGEAASIEVRLARAVALEGRVTGPLGAPLLHPEVRLFAADGRRARSTGDHALGVEGRYRVEGLAPGAHAAVVRARGAATTLVRDVRIEGPGPARADFALPEGGTVRVRVVDGEGAAAPLAAVACFALLADGGRIEVDRAAADAGGEVPPFRLAPGRYEFAVAESSRAEATVAAGETVSVTLERP